MSNDRVNSYQVVSLWEKRVKGTPSFDTYETYVQDEAHWICLGRLVVDLSATGVGRYKKLIKTFLQPVVKGSEELINTSIGIDDWPSKP